eukprot:359832-Chlamydomonas_euryale.AAC.18
MVGCALMGALWQVRSERCGLLDDADGCALVCADGCALMDAHWQVRAAGCVLTSVQMGALRWDEVRRIKDMINPKARLASPAGGLRRHDAFLYEIVSNTVNNIDVDKFDYLARDSYHCGIRLS